MQIEPSEYINDMGGNGCYLKNTAQTSAWSDEDKEYLASCIEVIDNFYKLSREVKTLTKINVFRREYAEKLKSWLKSLKDRYIWKPTEEQIMALKWALNRVPYDSYTEKLHGLLEQLKRL